MKWACSGFGGLLRAQGVLLGLIVVMIGMFLAQVLGPEGWDITLMTIPAAVIESWHHLRGGTADGVDGWILGTLLSAAFLHGDVFHLTGNLLYLWLFGALVSELLGWRWMLGIFFLSALGASASHVIIERDWIPMLGASGAISGFMGAYLGMAMRWDLPDPHIWPMAAPVEPWKLGALAAVFVAMDYHSLFTGTAGNIAVGAHVGGFTTGLLLTSLVAPMPRVARRRRA
ncbi:MAG: rhomboid family intramembrane serine protease [Akkermansiaceae bacterium]|nr:rhomboid family intramembrane serine protease [Akkermansiaceae bacterium]MCP5547994.1 rhomboid family intramembrane serine protease [Akkermansiaceae bacterium]